MLLRAQNPGHARTQQADEIADQPQCETHTKGSDTCEGCRRVSLLKHAWMDKYEEVSEPSGKSRVFVAFSKGGAWQDINVTGEDRFNYHIESGPDSKPFMYGKAKVLRSFSLTTPKAVAS